MEPATKIEMNILRIAGMESIKTGVESILESLTEDDKKYLLSELLREIK